MKKNNVKKIFSELDKKVKMVAMLAPSFIIQFKHPEIISQLKKLGFDKVVELTFGAKLVNREYQKKLKNNKELVIASPCPGVIEVVKRNYPKYVKNLAKIDSPMIATAKICKREFPKHKRVFISPCDYKKMEVDKSKFVDYVIDYVQLEELFKARKIKGSRKKVNFDKFYNDYTKIYPLSGGLAQTAHLKGVIDKDEIKSVDGIKKIMKFLDKPDPKIRFLDALYCRGGCVGGPYTTKKIGIRKKRKKVIAYRNKSSKKSIPEDRKGLYEKAKGLKFSH